MNEKALVVFVKNPELGKVKTRIAATTGPERALEIYNDLLNHTCQITQEVEASRLVFYSSFIPEYDLWSTDLFSKHLQSGNDLGERMENALNFALTNSSKAIIIGSDCFELTPSIINEAFELLDKAPVVIGPAKDGGYYLLGLTKMISALFREKSWSSTELFNETLNDCEVLGIELRSLPVLSDVDTEEDWLKTVKDRSS